MGPLPQPDSMGLLVDVVGLQHPHLGAGGAMQQSEHAHHRFMRVHVLVGCPPPKQLALLIEGEGPAAEAVRLLRDQLAGWVDQQQLLGPREAEELPQHGQPPLAALGQGGQEGFDIMHVDERPGVLVPFVDQEQGQVTQGRQGCGTSPRVVDT